MSDSRASRNSEGKPYCTYFYNWGTVATRVMSDGSLEIECEKRVINLMPGQWFALGLKNEASSSENGKHQFEEKPIGWLVYNYSGTGKHQVTNHRFVLGNLTDAIFMDEGDEAWPLYKKVSAGPERGST